MKKYLVLLLGVALLVAVAASPASPQAPPRSGVSAEEYAVYAALISEQYLNDKVRLVVVVNSTSGGSSLNETADYFLEQLAPLTRETLDDYLAVNSQSYRLSKSFPLKAKYVLVEYQEIEKFFANPDFTEAWKAFYKRFPASNGYVSLSRVGFNPAKDQALVSMAWMCNSLCGEGKLVLMGKRDGKWRVETYRLMWAS